MSKKNKAIDKLKQKLNISDTLHSPCAYCKGPLTKETEYGRDCDNECAKISIDKIFKETGAFPGISKIFLNKNL